MGLLRLPVLGLLAFCPALWGQDPAGDGREDNQRDNDTPFQLEDLLPDKNRLSLTWRNNYVYSGADSNVIVAQSVDIGADAPVLIPLQLDENSTSDTLLGGLELGYGWSRRLSVFAGFNAFARRTANIVLQQRNLEMDHGLANAYLGLSYKLTPVAAPFYQTLSISGVLAQRQGDDYVHGKSASMGWSGFYAFDPLVLSLSASWTHQRQRQVDGQSLRPGALLSLNPAISFAVNPAMSLDWSVTLSRMRDTRTDGQSQLDGGRTRATLGLGLTWSISSRMRWQIGSNLGMGGNDSSSIGMTMLYKP